MATVGASKQAGARKRRLLVVDGRDGDAAWAWEFNLPPPVCGWSNDDLRVICAFRCKHPSDPIHQTVDCEKLRQTSCFFNQTSGDHSWQKKEPFA
jgi:hypothetical protein